MSSGSDWWNTGPASNLSPFSRLPQFLSPLAGEPAPLDGDTSRGDVELSLTVRLLGFEMTGIVCCRPGRHASPVRLQKVDHEVEYMEEK